MTIEPGDGASTRRESGFCSLINSTLLNSVASRDVPILLGIEIVRSYAPGPMCGSTIVPSSWIRSPNESGLNDHQLGSATTRQPAAGLPSQQSTVALIATPRFSTSL